MDDDSTIFEIVHLKFIGQACVGGSPRCLLVQVRARRRWSGVIFNVLLGSGSQMLVALIGDGFPRLWSRRRPDDEKNDSNQWKYPKRVVPIFFSHSDFIIVQEGVHGGFVVLQ